jgi:hypothetical protein
MHIVFQYAVKVVLGPSEGDVVAPGDYWTAINVHNPTATTVTFRKKVAIALPGEQPGPVTRFFEAKLGPDEALEIDRRDVFHHVGADRFLKGFVVLESPLELDVVAVYTAAGREGGVTTFHLERVAPRRLEVGLPDLVPVPDAQGSFCKREDSTLIVTVRNQGTTGAGPSTTRVDFGAYGTIDLPTPALAAGVSVDLPCPIPPGCFDPNCEFRIIVDVHNVVVEADEGNNFASGVCLG